MSREYTQAQKEFLYDADAYSFSAPPVCIAYWNRADWIKFIDASGHWNDYEVTRLIVDAIHAEEDETMAAKWERK